MNDPWLECWQEALRLAARTNWRLQRWLLQRRLTVAVHQLGELGWQQADFDPEEPHILELQTKEQKQARLVFEIAEKKETIAELKESSRKHLAALQDQIDQVQTGMEQGGIQLHRLEKMLDEERSRKASAYLVESIQEPIAKERCSISEASAHLCQLQIALARDKAEFRRDLRRLQSDLRKQRAELRALHQQKAVHFTHIGHELADVGIAPVNQPEILTLVLAHREKLGDLE
ncbi:MAG TPA: hypothetical protein VF585_11865, partial [Chthoniobacterales bacterium]